MKIFLLLYFLLQQDALQAVVSHWVWKSDEIIILVCNISVMLSTTNSKHDYFHLMKHFCIKSPTALRASEIPEALPNNTLLFVPYQL